MAALAALGLRTTVTSFGERAACLVGNSTCVTDITKKESVTDVDSRGASVSGRSRTGRKQGIGALGRRHDSQGAMRERHGRGLLTRTRALVMQNIVGRFARTQS